MRAVNNNLAAPSVDGGKAWIGAEGFLCSRNARPPKALAWANGTSRRDIGWAGEKAARSQGIQPGRPLASE